MSQTVDRVPAPVPLVKAADHSADHNSRDQQQFDQREDEAPASPVMAEPHAGEGEDVPAVVLDTSVHAQTPAPLGGVAAYQETARHAIEALRRDPALAPEPLAPVPLDLGPPHSGDDGLPEEAKTPGWRLGSEDS